MSRFFVLFENEDFQGQFLVASAGDMTELPSVMLSLDQKIPNIEARAARECAQTHHISDYGQATCLNTGEIESFVLCSFNAVSANIPSHMKIVSGDLIRASYHGKLPQNVDAYLSHSAKTEPA